MNRQCVVCGVEFTTKSSRRQVCSPTCQVARDRQHFYRWRAQPEVRERVLQAAQGVRKRRLLSPEEHAQYRAKRKEQYQRTMNDPDLRERQNKRKKRNAQLIRDELKTLRALKLNLER